MTIAASGEISLGVNSDVTRSVACELALGGTSQICMDQALVRALAGRTSAGSAICFCNFYNKNAPPAGLGCAYQGGYYTGTVSSPANYYLVVSPNASGCTEGCAWKTDQTNSNSSSTTDGYGNTYNNQANAAHPAGNWTATRSINGFSDWYLPAKDELNLMYTNRGSMPSGQGYPGAPFASLYWSSTDFQAGPNFLACTQYFCNGAQRCNIKTFTAYGGAKQRAIRRVPF